MAAQLSISGIHSGQLLWALCPKYPYWPSIVCPSESGEFQDKSQSVHVRFCASNRKSCWVKLENVFEFNGHESFLAKKLSMKSKMSENDFKKAFDTSNNDAWRKAVVEATLVMNKDLSIRLDFFDVLNMCDDISCEMSKVASGITFEGENTKARTNAENLEQRTVMHSITKAAVELPKPSPQKKSDEKGRRRSVPLQRLQPNIIENLPTKERTESLELQVAAQSTATAVKKVRRHSDSHKQPKPKPARKSPSESSFKKPTKLEKFEDDLLTYQSYPKEKLHDGMPQGNICKMCWSTENRNDLVKCSDCGDLVHSACLDNNYDESYVQLPDESPIEQRQIKIRFQLCDECPSKLICYACKEPSTAQMKQCRVRLCGRLYHPDCLTNWKQTKFVYSKMNCPLHVCHTCFSRNTNRQITKGFTYCVKCPTTYHFEACCIPAGTKLLTRTRHICIRHCCGSNRKVPSLDWCFRCGKEGDAILSCGTCPKSYHMSCLNLSEIPHSFLCESCVIGSNPLYGEIVIAKYGIHPWWPAVIVPQFVIPCEMFDTPHNDHEFCIRFFGTYNFGFIGRSSVYLYSKDHASKVATNDPAQKRALSEAANWLDKIQNVTNNNNESVTIASEKNGPKPKVPQFVKITTLIQVAPAKLTKSKDEPGLCSCSPDDDDPCGPTSNCENRQIKIECDANSCPTASKCNNQSFGRRNYPRVKVTFISKEKGFGLIADEFMFAGTLVIEYVGELITETEFQRRHNRKEKDSGTQHYYFMEYSKGLYIDAEHKGNSSRFVNHSCEPNCNIERWTVNKLQRIGIVALRDIEKGNEITVNYGFAAEGKRHECFCGEKKCKGIIEK